MLSAGAIPTEVAHPLAGSREPALRLIESVHGHRIAADLAQSRTGLWVPIHHLETPSLPTSFLAFRITNTPWQTPVNLVPPFQQVLVQNRQPVPGQTYNILYVVVKNGTSQTFTASNGFTVRVNNQPRSQMLPILTGTQVWKPNQWIVFYVLSKQYYPVSPVAGGFELFLGGRRSTLVPGPSGIFLRIKYDPSRFAQCSTGSSHTAREPSWGRGRSLGCPTRRSTRWLPHQPAGSISGVTSRPLGNLGVVLWWSMRAESTGTEDPADCWKGWQTQ